MENLVLNTYALVCKIMYRSFEKETKSASKTNHHTLMSILDKNKNTEYGQNYNFESMRDYDDYKDIVPLSNYETYKNYIQKMQNSNDKYITYDEIKYFSLSSGTTGEQKLIPITKKTLSLSLKYMAFVQMGAIYSKYPTYRCSGRGLNIMNMNSYKKTNSNIDISTATSGGMKHMKKFYNYLWVTPVEAVENSKEVNLTYIHLLFSLYEEKLTYITGTFSSHILNMIIYLKDNWIDLVNDIEKGIINSTKISNVELKNKLERKMKPNSKRAEELRKEFEKGFKDIIPRVWKNMICICTVNGGSFSVYGDKLRYYLGIVPIYSANYSASEAIIAFATTLNKAEYAIVPSTVFFEFIPIEYSDDDNPITITLDRVEVGKQYEIVITNYSGLYRYRLGDVIKVVDFFNQTPLIEFMYRKNQLLNLVGEKTSELSMRQAIENTFAIYNIEILDFTTREDVEYTPPRYVIYVETINDNNNMNEKLSQTLEDELMKANDSYRRNLLEKRISSLQLRLVKKDTFKQFKACLISQGMSENQMKIPRVIRKNEHIDFFEENNIKKYIHRCKKHIL